MPPSTRHCRRRWPKPGAKRCSADLFGQPDLPLIDGRGKIWWPGASDVAALYDYTLGQQVTESYDFTRAVTVAAREFAPDLFIVLGPGTTLGGAVAQSLILAGWRGMGSKADFRARQADGPAARGHGNARPARRRYRELVTPETVTLPRTAALPRGPRLARRKARDLGSTQHGITECRSQVF